MKPLKCLKHLGIENGPLIMFSNKTEYNEIHSLYIDTHIIYTTVLRISVLNPTINELITYPYRYDREYAQVFNDTLIPIDTLKKLK